MANATLEMMQEIEMAAEAVVASYEDQVQDLRQQLGDHLQEVAASYDKETAKLVAEREESSRATIASLEADLAVTSQRNDEKVQQAMTNKRAALVDEIVEKVVATYGNEPNATPFPSLAHQSNGRASLVAPVRGIRQNL